MQWIKTAFHLLAFYGVHPQAPQRERVSLAALPLSAQEKRTGRRRKQRRWRELLRPDVNMGVPQLMMILEPNIVWDHTHNFNNVVGKEVEAQYCPGTCPAAYAV